MRRRAAEIRKALQKEREGESLRRKKERVTHPPIRHAILFILHMISSSFELRMYALAHLENAASLFSWYVSASWYHPTLLSYITCGWGTCPPATSIALRNVTVLRRKVREREKKRERGRDGGGCDRKRKNILWALIRLTDPRAMNIKYLVFDVG